MSSVNWKKIHGKSELHAMVAHNARHDGRENVSYRNTDIDKTLTRHNYCIRQKTGRRYDSYDTSAEYSRLQKRIEDIDHDEPPQRRRKDRVTALSFVVTVPAELDGLHEKERHFFTIAYREISNLCGGPSNVSTGWVHVDEKHEYVEPVTRDIRTSRSHMHVIGLPYVPGVGINCNRFFTKTNLRQLNNNIDRACREQLGVPFMVGVTQAAGRSVEDLKIESIKAERAEMEKTRQKKNEMAAAFYEVSKSIECKKHELEQLKVNETTVKDRIAVLHHEKDTAETAAAGAKKVAEKEQRKAEDLFRKTEELKSSYRSVADKYNFLVRRFNGLLKRAVALGMAITAYTARKGTEQIQERSR